MRWSIVALVIVGIVAAVAAAVLVGAISANTGVGADGNANQVEILVAARTIEEGSQIDGDDVETKTVRRSEVNPSTKTGDPVTIIGSILIKDMVKGEPFMANSFAPSGHLAYRIPEGMRAMAIELTDSASLQGLITPGSYVDVLMSFKRDAQSDPISKTVLEWVRVLAIEQQTILDEQASSEEASASDAARQARRGNKQTVLVKPDQAEVLQSASVQGTISLAMRNPTDSTGRRTEPPTPAELQANLPRFRDVEVIRNGKRHTFSFEYETFDHEQAQ